MALIISPFAPLKLDFSRCRHHLVSQLIDKESAKIAVSSQFLERKADVAAVNEQVVSTNTQSVTKEDVQTTAKNQDKLGGGLHIGLDQSGNGLEGDFSGKKIGTLQSEAELDVNEQSLSTNAQSMTREDVQTTAENQDIFEGGLHIGLDQSETGLEGDFSGKKVIPPRVRVSRMSHQKQ